MTVKLRFRVCPRLTDRFPNPIESWQDMLQKGVYTSPPRIRRELTRGIAPNKENGRINCEVTTATGPSELGREDAERVAEGVAANLRSMGFHAEVREVRVSNDVASMVSGGAGALVVVGAALFRRNG